MTSMSDNLQYGPNTAQVQAMLGRLRSATSEELETLGAATQGAARGAARVVAREAAKKASTAAARDAFFEAAWEATSGVVWDAWRATRDAVLATLVRDLILPADFDVLTGPWREVFGPTWEDSWT